MENNFKRVKICDGVHFSSITDSRYKINRISVKFLSQLDEETASINAVIPKILSKSSQAYPDFAILNNKLSSLYAARLSDTLGKYGDMQAFGVAVSAIDNAFALENEDVISEATDILIGCLFNPLTEDGAFPNQSFELEKQSLIDDIEAKINDKMAYASYKGLELGVRGEPAAILSTGSVEAAKKLDNRASFEQYKKVISQYPVEIICAGCNDFEAVKEKFTAVFKSLSRSNATNYGSAVSALKSEIVTEVEKMSVTQSKMTMIFKTECTDYPALSVMCDIFGGSPSSKLFMNVREKMSLCYYCWSRLQRAKGLMTINCGIENENIEKARTEILRQFELMKSGDFSDEDIANSKLGLQNKYNSVADSLSGISDWYFTEITRNSSITPSAEIENINAVSKDRIIAAAKSVQLDSVYILTSE